MRARAAFFVLVAVFFVFCGAPLAAEEEPRTLVIFVADFDSSGISEADLKEYVDYLAADLERSLVRQVQASGPYTEGRVIRGPSSEQASSAQAAAREGAQVLLVSGALKKTPKRYAVVVHVANRATGSHTATLEHAYRDEQELYSGCAELARDLALACVGGQPGAPPRDAREAPGEALRYWSGPLWAAGIAAGYGAIPDRESLGRPADGYFFLLRGFYGRAYNGWPLGVALDISAAGKWSEGTDDLLLGADLYASAGGLIALGLNFSYSITPDQADPCLGLSFGFSDFAPLWFFTLGLGAVTVRWNLTSGECITSLRLITVTIGLSNKKSRGRLVL
jgi:hypothetical protein